MKNTKANIIKLLEAMSKHHWEMSRLWEKEGYPEYAKRSTIRAAEIENILDIITDDKRFVENWEIFEYIIKEREGE